MWPSCYDVLTVYVATANNPEVMYIRVACTEGWVTVTDYSSQYTDIPSRVTCLKCRVHNSFNQAAIDQDLQNIDDEDVRQ